MSYDLINDISRQIDDIYKEIDRLNKVYTKRRITAGGVDNIHRLKDKAKQLIELRKNAYSKINSKNTTSY